MLTSLLKYRRNDRMQRLGMLLCAILFCISLPGPTPARAAGTVGVTTLTDEITNNGTCSLREALQAINQPGSPYNNNCGSIPSDPVTITFSSVGTITLSTASGFGTLPFITRNVAISGPVTINGNNQTIFRVPSNGILSLANMTITNGNTAIFMNGGILNVAGVAFLQNKSGSDGGAIGGLTGRVSVAGSVFTGNEAEGIDGGGAIYLRGSDPLSVAGSAFNGNIAKRSGGAIYALAPTTLTDVVFNGNIANASDPNNNGTEGDPADTYDQFGGGAIHASNDSSNDRKMVITRGVFNGNITVRGHGGAVYNSSGSTLEIRESAFNGNIAGIPALATGRSAGAVKNMGGTLLMVRSSLMNNTVVGDGGAISNDRNGQMTLGNLTLNSNTATARGGGIANINSQTGSDIRPRLTAINVTIAQNDADGQGGGIFAQAPTNSHPEVVRLTNTIVSGSDTSGMGGNCAGGGVQSQGNNLDSGASCGFNQPGDLSSANAALAAPSFNGGIIAQLLTQDLGGASQAADAANNAACAAAPIDGVDARGYSRPKGAACDIGAFEADPPAAGYSSTPVQPGPVVFGNVTFGQQQDVSLTVANTGNKTLQLSNPQISGANAADFAILIGFPLNVDAPTQIPLRCAPTGSTPGTRSATLTIATNDELQTSVNYTLVCNAVAQPVPGFGSTPAAPGPLDFGTVVVGVAKNTTISVQEIGTATLTVNNAVLGGANPGDFAVGAVNLSLANGAAAASITVGCTPTATGMRSATLTLSTNDPTKPTVVFNLSCIGRTAPTPPLIYTNQNYAGSAIIGMDQPYGLAITPDGSKVIVAAMSGDVDGGAAPEGSLTLFTRNATTGALTQVAALTDPDDHLRGAIRLLVSPDGNYLYVSAHNVVSIAPSPSAGRVIAYRISNNSLVKIDTVAEGSGYGICLPLPCTLPTINTLGGAYGLALSPESNYLYVTSAADNRVVVLGVKKTTGSDNGGIGLGIGRFPVQQFSDSSLSNPYDILLSPDGAYVYVANYGAGSNSNIAVFARNVQNGQIGARVQQITQAQIAGLGGVFRLALSPDGSSLYTAGYNSSSVVVFQRNPFDGKLTYLNQTFTNGVAGVSGLAAATAVTVSPDGRHVFATGFDSNAVVSFERDTATGLLTYVNPPIARTDAGQPQLGGARDIIVEPGNKQVYATGFNDDRVVMLPYANPIPAIESLAPASAPAGAGNTTVTINGSNFVPNATVRWTAGGVVDFPATFVSSSQLRITVGSALLASAGTATVRVINPNPGGGNSPNSLLFTITAPAANPVPSIDEISPSSAPAGGIAPTIVVKGAGFIDGSVVRWNGADRTTFFVSSTTLQAVLLTSDVAQPGTSAVTVRNATPGGGTSNALAFSVAAPGQNPTPTLNSLDPAGVLAGANGSIDLIISGSGFIEQIQGRWNGADRPTQLLNSTTVRMSLNAADLMTAGIASIDMVNPSPGGGASNALSFTVAAVGQNLVPSISRVSTIVFNANGTRTVTIRGSGFVSGAQVRWNGANRSTSFVNSTTLRVTLSAADLAKSAAVAIFNPAPGGGLSNEIFYTMPRQRVPFVVK